MLKSEIGNKRQVRNICDWVCMTRSMRMAAVEGARGTAGGKT